MLKQPHQLSKIWNHTWKHSPQHTTFSGHPISTETRYLSYDTVISLHFLMCFSSPSHKGKSNHPCVPKLRWLPVGSSFWCQNHSFKTTIIISWKLLGHLHCPPPHHPATPLVPGHFFSEVQVSFALQSCKLDFQTFFREAVTTKGKREREREFETCNLKKAIPERHHQLESSSVSFIAAKDFRTVGTCSWHSIVGSMFREGHWAGWCHRSLVRTNYK